MFSINSNLFIKFILVFSYRNNTGPIPKTFEYNMKHAKRGIALIFNHEIFANPIEHGQRQGTNADCDKMVQTLGNLHFDVRVYNNLPLAEIMHRMRQGTVCSLK